MLQRRPSIEYIRTSYAHCTWGEGRTGKGKGDVDGRSWPHPSRMSCMYVHVCHPVHSMFCPLHIRRKKVASSPPCPDLIPTAPLLFGFALLTCLPLVPISSSSSLASSLSPPLEWIPPSDERDRLRGSNEEGGGGGRKNEAVVHYTLHSTVAYARS